MEDLKIKKFSLFFLAIRCLRKLLCFFYICLKGILGGIFWISLVTCLSVAYLFCCGVDVFLLRWVERNFERGKRNNCGWNKGFIFFCWARFDSKLK